MRHTKEQLSELLHSLAPQLSESVTYGIEKISKAKDRSIYASNKRALFSHNVRSYAFDYLAENPIDGVSLLKERHNLNQAVALIHDASGLEIRLVKLRNIKQSSQPPITHIDEDPAITQALFDLELQFQKPGLVGVSYTRPKLDADGLPLEEIEMVAVRASRNTKLRDGKADAVIPLTHASTLLPKHSFDPNVDDYGFEEDKEDEEQDNA